MAADGLSEEKQLEVYEWFKRAVKNNDLIRRISPEDANQLLWSNRYDKEQPALIAHPNYGPCLIHARREVSGYLGASLSYFLVTLVTPLEDKQLKVARSGFFQVPHIISIEDKDGNEQPLDFVYPVSCLITKFVLVEPKESSIVEVYDGNTYTRMLLSELRQRIDVERNLAHRIAFDAFKQSNPAFVAATGISAATVSTEEADARLISSKLDGHHHRAEVRYALAPQFLHGMLRENVARKKTTPIESCIGVRMHDPHGVIKHLHK